MSTFTPPQGSSFSSSTRLFPLAKLFSLSLLATLIAAVTTHECRAGSYFQDFTGSTTGATSFSDGSQLISSPVGAAQVADSNLKELQLTDHTIGSTLSAWMLPDLDPGARVGAFSAKWNAVIYGNFPNAADGYSFNFGPLRNQNFTDNGVANEAGFGKGLSVGVQVWGANQPGFHLRCNGKDLAYVPANPSTTWGNFNSTRHFFEVDWDYANGLTLRMDGQTIFTNVPTPTYIPQKGNSFVFAARTGGAAATIRIDNVVVVTGGTLTKVATSNPYYSNAGNFPSHETDKAFDGSDNTYWTALGVSGYAGATVTNTAVRVIALTAANTGGGSVSDPTTWSFDGSANGGASWTACTNGTAVFMLRPETRAFLSTGTQAFTAYRLNCNSGALAELRMWAFNPVSLPEFFNINPGFPTLQIPYAAWGDYDNDGFLDLAYCGLDANLYGVMQLWHNNGNGSFTLNTNTAFPQIGGSSVVWGDFDQDGYVDLVIAGINAWPRGGPTQIWRNNGNGTFSQMPRALFNPLHLGNVVTLDYNRDGRLDLLFCGTVRRADGTYGGSTTELWRNNGNGTFSYVSSGIPTMQDGKLAVADYDNDGWTDVLLTGYADGNLQTTLMRNQGNGTFGGVGVSGIQSFRYGACAWVDYNNDNAFDFNLGGTDYRNGINPICTLWKGNPTTHTFTQPASGFGALDQGTGNGPNFSWTDYDNNGYPDLLFSGGNVMNGLGLLRNNTDGTFSRVSLPSSCPSDGVNAWADIDGDGCQDFLVSGGNGGGLFNGLFYNTRTSTNKPPGVSAAAGAQTPSGNNVVIVGWAPSAPNLGTTPVGGLTYNLRLGTTPGGSDIFNPMALTNGKRKVIGYGNMWKMTNLSFALPKGTYYGAVQVIDANYIGGPFSSEFTFTIGANGSAPTVTTGSATALTPGSGQLNATVNANGAATGAYFEWGSTAALGNSTTPQSVGNYLTATTTFTNLTGLNPGATYYYRCVATNANGTVTGSTQTFTTLGAVPGVTTGASLPLSFNVVQLFGIVNPNYLDTKAWVEYGIGHFLFKSSITNLTGTDANLNVSFPLAGLAPGQVYDYRLVASNSLGQVTGTAKTFRTLGFTEYNDLTQPFDTVSGTSANSPAGNGPGAATDNNISTAYINNDILNAGLIITPAISSLPVRAVTLSSAGDNPQNDPASFTLEGSTNGSTFYLITSNAVPSFADRFAIQSFAFSNDVAYTSYRLRFPTVANYATANALQVSEVELLPHPEFTSVYDTISAGTDGNQWSTPDKLLAGKVTLNEDKFAVNGATSNIVVTLTPAAGMTVLKGFELIGCNDDSIYPERHPLTVVVQGSPDGTNYGTFGVFQPRVPLMDRYIEGFNILNNTAEMRSYRFIFSKQTSGTWWQLGQLKLFGEVTQPTRPVILANSSAGQMSLTWTNWPIYELEQSSTVTGPWFTVTNPVSSNNGVSTTTIPQQSAAQFFRLRLK